MITPYFCRKKKIVKITIYEKNISFILLCCTAYADDSLLKIKQNLERIDRDISDLQKELFSKKNNQQLINDNNQSESSDLTVFDMRLRDIDIELKTINLNYENMAFEIEELKNVLEELSLNLNNSIISQNNELEELSLQLNKSIIDEDNEIIEKSSSEVQETEQQNQSDNNTLGTLVISSDDLSESSNKIEENKKTNNLLPEEEFQIAFDYLRTSKFVKAKSSLETFIINNPSHVLAGSAKYWLGEINLLKKEYREAALVFAEGYQKYPKSFKAPDTLYKLAEALIKIEKKDEACETLNQLLLKYPNHKLINKTQLIINDLQCN